MCARERAPFALFSFLTCFVCFFRLAAAWYLSGSEKLISVWHDIPLYVRDERNKPTGLFNFVCEIPRCSRKKFEIATKEAGNPIKQDTKMGVLREFKKVRKKKRDGVRAYHTHFRLSQNSPQKKRTQNSWFYIISS